MEEIKFSIMTPVFNVEPYLQKCLDSVSKQTYKNFEFILVDDGSTDKSGVMCDEYVSTHPFAKVFHKQNGGLMSSRQFALQKASGDYFLFLDSDDWIEDNALETIFNYIKEYDTDCIVFGYKRVTDSRVISKTPDEGIICLKNKDDIYLKCFCDSRYNPLCRKAVKATLFKGNDYSSYYYLSHAEDLLQSIEVYKNCTKILFVDDKLYNYRVNPSSITNQQIPVDYKPDFTIRKTVWDFLLSENVLSDKQFENYKQYAVRIFFDEINCIASSKLTIHQKKTIFNNIRECDYFKSYLLPNKNGKAQKRKPLVSFSKGHYNGLIVKGALISLYKKTKRLFKGKK